MKAFYKKSMAVFLGMIMVLSALFSFPVAVSASHEKDDDDPKIKEIRKVSRTSVTLPIKFEKREGDRVLVRVSVENTRTGEKFTRNIRTKLSDDEGRRSVVVDGLNPGTEYKFKIKVRKAGGGDFSDSSDTRKAVTAL